MAALLQNKVDEDDAPPQLAPDVILLLQEMFEPNNLDEQFKIEENWNLSQFWYDEDTISQLVRIAVNAVGSKGKIALVSCPSVYKKMKESLDDEGVVTLFEYDKRFAVHGNDFVPYDYNTPLEIPNDCHGFYDIVLADPPFLSQECLTKTAQTIRFLTNNKILLCTGAVMEDLAKRLMDLTMINFVPKHKNNLANEFNCYTNFNVIHNI